MASPPELGDASDLALLDGTAFTLDHNWDAPRPTFRRIEVPGASLQLAVRELSRVPVDPASPPSVSAYI